MTIKEKGYSHWDGEFSQKKLPWWPITRYGIKLTLKKKFFKLTYAIALIPAIVFLVMIYMAERIEDFSVIMEGQSELIKVNPALFNTYLTNDFLLFMITVILVFAGAGLTPQTVDRRVHTVDIAPTLSAFLGIKPPSGSVGEPLEEVTRKGKGNEK